MPTTDKLKTRDSDHHPPRHYPFWFGGSASCFAAVVTHPLDLSMPKATHDTYGAGKYSTSICSSVLICVYSQGRILSLPSMALICSPFSFPDIRSQPCGQVRLQTRALDGPKGMTSTFLHILRSDGVRGLYNGVRLPKSGPHAS